jgi:creatinine amidohydrolase/Fe(II)-dependent formamide hydrolase-like protein
MKGGVLDAKKLKESGPFQRSNREVLIYSIGASNEGHGSALPSNIDDYTAIRTAVSVSEQAGFTYRGHLPYSSDRSGLTAMDWNPGYIKREDLIKNVVIDIKRDIQNLEKYCTRTSHIAVIGGHGGNNFIKDEETKLFDALGVPFLYVPPFPGVYAKSKKYGKVVITHADHGEHSVALYLGLLDKEKLEKINKIAKKDPIEALRQNPPIMGLGFYVLPELGGDRYKDLRSRHKDLLDVAIRFVKRDKRVIADYDVGRQLFEGNVIAARKQIENFVKAK